MRLTKICFLILIIIIAVPVFGQEENDISGTLFHHILDGNTIQIFPFTPELTLPLGMTVHQLMLLLAAVITAGLFIFAASRKSRKPAGIRILVENLLLFVRDDIVYPVMGEENGVKWLPFFVTQFLFILVTNLLGLIPAFKSATGNINVTASLALMVLLITFIAGMKELGIFRFFKNLYPEGISFPVGIFVALLEFTGIFTKSIVLSLRLFANMFAGHLAILSFLVLIFVISPFFGFVALPFAVFTYLLEVLVAFIQSFVFTLLSCIFIMMAITPEEE